jgi:hypothetical protein
MAKYNEKWDFTKWFILIVVLVAIAGGLFAFTGAGGKLFGTFVERKVFEQSYQRSEGLKAKIATFEAQLAEIDAQINQTADTFTRNDLLAKRAAIVVQLRAARSQQ